MAKIPFNVKFRPQIESGEYKVETRDGRPVRIICWDRVAKENTDADLNICVLVPEDKGEAVYYYHQSGKKWVSCERFDLFIITPEPELSEWETLISGCLQKHGLLDCGAADRIAKECSAELLSLAIDVRAIEMDEALEKSKLDKDGIPYHLIEFMCNLYTCRNWKEIEETAELYVTRIKAAAMKDLPRWKKWGNGVCGDSGGRNIALVESLGDFRLVSALDYTGEKYLTIDDLKKLPGFKED